MSSEPPAVQEQLVPALIGLITGGGGLRLLDRFLTSRQRSQESNQRVEERRLNEAVKKSDEAMRALLAVTERVGRLEGQVIAEQAEKRALQAQNAAQAEQITALVRKVNDLEGRVSALQTENARLRETCGRSPI